MKKIYALVCVLMMALGAYAEKMMFTVEGPEEEYNQVRVINATSLDNLRCRVVVLDDSGKKISYEYGVFDLVGKGDTDTSTKSIKKGVKLGIQIAENVKTRLNFSVEYMDRPLFDAVIIRLYDEASGFTSEF